MVSAKKVVATSALSACVVAGSLVVSPVYAMPVSPSESPSVEVPAEDTPTEEPTDAPTAEPTDTPTDEPTDEPTDAPTDEPGDPETPDVPVNPDVDDVTGVVGSKVTVTGSGFTPDSTVTFDTAFGRFSVPDVQADSSGAFTVDVPVGAGERAGVYPVSAKDSSGEVARFTVTINMPDNYDPSPSLSRDFVTAGDYVTVRGTGYIPGDEVSVKLPFLDGENKNVTVRVDDRGEFEYRVQVPAGAVPLPYFVEVKDSQQLVPKSLLLNVTRNVRDVEVSAPSEVTVGDTFEVTVEGVTPHGDVTVGGIRVQADEDGRASARVTAPDSPGEFVVSVVDEASDSEGQARVNVISHDEDDSGPTLPGDDDDTPGTPPGDDDGGDTDTPPGDDDDTDIPPGDGGDKPGDDTDVPPGDDGGDTDVPPGDDGDKPGDGGDDSSPGTGEGKIPPGQPRPDDTKPGNNDTGDDNGDKPGDSDKTEGDNTDGDDENRPPQASDTLEKPTERPESDGAGNVPDTPENVDTSGDDAPVPDAPDTTAGDEDPVPVPEDDPTNSPDEINPEEGSEGDGGSGDDGTDVTSEGSKDSDLNSLSVGNVLGGVAVGALALIAAVGAAFWFIAVKRRKKNDGGSPQH